MSISVIVGPHADHEVGVVRLAAVSPLLSAIVHIPTYFLFLSSSSPHPSFFSSLAMLKAKRLADPSGMSYLLPWISIAHGTHLQRVQGLIDRFG